MLSITTGTVSIIAMLALLLIVPINGSCMLPSPGSLCGAGDLPHLGASHPRNRHRSQTGRLGDL